MPQMQMAFFPQGVTHINPMLAFSKAGGKIAYVTGNLQIYSHEEDDSVAFKMITAQFCANGMAKQAEVVRAFGVPSLAVKRAVKLFRQEGTRGFYKPRKRRAAAVLTPQVCAQVEALLDSGLTITEVAEQNNIKRDTLSKAVRAGRLRPLRAIEADRVLSKSGRSEQDSAAPMGMGASNVQARVAASLGQLVAVAPSFEPALDVPCGGVLFALPALLAVGLLDKAEDCLKLPDGYYGLDSLLLLCAFMALVRLESLECLRYRAPGEWGKLLGLDRIPEVRQQTQLPKHHVTRQKLCLRATTDYWVNAMDGQPFFMVNQAVDPGMLTVIERDILPQLEQQIPNLPEAPSTAHRFTLVFDREGYSPVFFLRMKKRRVACLTYHKFPAEAWADEEFHACPVRLHRGEIVSMDLAERGTRLSNNLWVREVRKRTARGHQTAVISTDFGSELGPLAGSMFSRWSQENYFRYAREHFALDRLAEYATDTIPDTLKLVNPVWRELDGQVRKATATLSRLMAKFGATQMTEGIEVGKMERWLEQKAQLKEEIEHLQEAVNALKATRKDTPHHVSFKELPEDQKFRQLRQHGKQLVDTIKMIAYRAETAMANILRQVIKRPDEARTLLRALYSTEADIIPDFKAQTLTVRLHHMAQNVSDLAIQKLCDELNETETVFPRTNLRLILKLGSN